MTELAEVLEPNGSLPGGHEERHAFPGPIIQESVTPMYIDIGWALIRADAINICGVWAEDKGGGEQAYMRVYGESFALTHEELLYIQHALGYSQRSTALHDKYAALIDEHSCFNKANFGEPLFILRAQDEFAAELVRAWADKVEAAIGPDAPATTRKKIEDAREVADQMEVYPGRKVPD
jgi:hypothetical protein